MTYHEAIDILEKLRINVGAFCTKDFKLDCETALRMGIESLYLNEANDENQFMISSTKKDIEKTALVAKEMYNTCVRKGFTEKQAFS